MTCTCSSHSTRHLQPGFDAGRRRFIKLAALGGGATLLLGRAPAYASGSAEALLLSCMDFRLVDDLVRYMDGRGLTNRYDHIVLAGASAGATQDKFKDWQPAFWQHLQVAIDLHKIHRVIVIDHRDCGAYKIAFGAEHAADADVELAVHAAVLCKLARAIQAKYPKLAVETHLMALDGSVTAVNSGTGSQNCTQAAAALPDPHAGGETETHAN